MFAVLVELELFGGRRGIYDDAMRGISREIPRMVFLLTGCGSTFNFTEHATLLVDYLHGGRYWHVYD